MLAKQPELRELAARSGQRGATEFLRYFLTGPYVGPKVPTLLLVYGAEIVREGERAAEVLVGAVIVQEYRTLGMGSGIFMTDDEVGERTVIARPEARAWVAARAVASLLEGGAKLVLLSMQVDAGRGSGELAAISQRDGARCRWGGTVKTMDQYLPLRETLDATLGTMGKHTRRNLRSYRRRAEERLGSEFVARAEMTRAEFIAVNRVCSYPVPDAVAGWRYDSTMALADGLFVGVRGGDGAWLSVMGGRHFEDWTAIAWQMNREGMPSYSLSTMMRSYLLEYEVGRGTRRLYFDGGTPHSIHEAFVTSQVTYAVAVRRSMTGTTLRRGLASVLPKNNFLSRVLRDEGMRWERG